MNSEVVIAGACRTPIGRFLGSLSEIHPKELGRIAGAEALKRAGVGAGDIDELVCGNVIQAGLGGNISRQIQGALGIPWDRPACTVNQLCASAMRAFEIGAHNILLGKTDTCLVVGVENMTMAPYLIAKGRTGYRMGPGTLDDAMLLDALICSIEGYHMGMTAENIAKRYGITRAEQDELALLSQQRAAAAIRSGVFGEEIVPVEVVQKKKAVTCDTDEHPRPDTTADVLTGLKPAFTKDGTVTAGNASGVNDGAAAVVLMSGEAARKRGIVPMGRILSTASVGAEPAVMGLSPAFAIPRALERAGVGSSDIDYFEINEAFAAQFIGVERVLESQYGITLDRETINRNGSGISLGHPVGCTGLRIVVSLVYEMKRSGCSCGCASLCAGGGPGMAAVIQNVL